MRAERSVVVVVVMVVAGVAGVEDAGEVVWAEAEEAEINPANRIIIKKETDFFVRNIIYFFENYLNTC